MPTSRDYFEHAASLAYIVFLVACAVLGNEMHLEKESMVIWKPKALGLRDGQVTVLVAEPKQALTSLARGSLRGGNYASKESPMNASGGKGVQKTHHILNSLGHSECSTNMSKRKI